MSNILEVTFESGQTFATAQRLWKGDYGQILLIHGPELPSYYEVHFASTKDGTPEVSVGTPSGVQIPNRLLQADGYIYAWVFLHVGVNDGATKFQVKIPVEERGIPIDQETPEDQTAVQQAIAALNAETGRAEAAADAAEVSEQNAKASEDAAALSEQNAEDAAQAAATSAENAAISETGAAESEAAAAASAQQAATSAEAAAQYAASAGGSEELVEEYARRAKGSADTAELYGTMAVNAKDAAEASARSATQASQAAVSAKNIADTAAQTATQKASEASSSAGVASSQASMAAAEAAAASGYANNAEGSARQASASAEDAADSAEDADDSAASARLYNEQAQAAKVDAQTAAGNASAAQTAAEAAQTAAETAQGKAEDAQDAAEAAQSSAEAAQTAAETAQGLAEAAQAAAEAAQYIAEDAADQAQEWADRVPSMLPVDTADGPVASFPDGADDVPLKSLIVGINHVQDLHGYGSPWPAGKGVNRLPPLAAVTETKNGVTFTSDGNGTYTLKGTSTAATSFAYYFPDGMGFTTEVGDYWHLLNSQAKGSVTFSLRGSTYIAMSPANRIWAMTDNYAGATVTGIIFDMSANVTIDMTISPIICKTGTVIPFAPYSNECPISGWTGANVFDTGVNVWDEEWEHGKFNLTTGAEVADDTRVRSKNYFSVKAGETYHIVTPNTLFLMLYDEAKNYMYEADSTANYTIPAGVAYLRFSCSSGYGATYNNDISINYPSTDHDYHAYNGRTVNISWETEAGTVYGSSLKLNQDGTADLVVDRAEITFDGSLDEPMIDVSATNAYRVAVDLPFDSMTWTDLTHKSGKLWANEFAESDNYNTGEGREVGIHYRANGAHQLVIAWAHTVDWAGAVVVSARAWLAANPLQVVYTLAEPVTYHITNVELVKTLLGLNNLWADTGDVHAIYRADIGLYIQKLTGSTEEDMTANQNIASGKYFLVGNTLYLSTSAIAAGEQIIPGTNCTLTNLAAALNALNS